MGSGAAARDPQGCWVRILPVGFWFGTGPIAVPIGQMSAPSDTKAETPRRARRARRSGFRSAVPRRRAVVVLGMHRSGTSALTGALGLAGVDLPAHLMPATPANPRGYFESQVFYELHEELLAEAGRSWQDLSPFASDWMRSPPAARWVERLGDAFGAEFGASLCMVLKDPRLCRLIPLWERVFTRAGVEPGYVLVIRHPLEVAASLAREQQVDERKTLLLWLDHLLNAERDTRGLRRCVVTYDELLTDWRRVLQRIHDTLGLSFPRLTRRVEAQIDRFLARDLRHHRSQPRELALRADVVDWVKEVYDWALRASAGESAPTSALDRIAEDLDAAERAFGPILAKEELARARQAAEASQLAGALEAFRAEIARRDKEIGRIDEELQGARNEIALRTSDAVRLREDLDERQRHLERIVDWVKVLLQWATQLTLGSGAPSRSLEVVFRALDAAEPAQIPAVATAGLQLAERAAQLAHLEGEIERLRGELAATRAEASRLDQLAARLRAEQQIAADRGAARDAKVARLGEELARVAGQLQSQGEDLRRREEELLRREEELAQAASRLAVLSEELQRSQAEVADRDLYLERLKQRIAAIEGSLAWRALRPARALARGAGEVLRK